MSRANMKGRDRDNYQCPASHRRIPVSRAVTSSENGCVSCRLILDAVEIFLPGWSTEHPDTKDIRIDGDIAATCHLLEDRRRVGGFGLYFESQGKASGSSLFDRARHWLSYCLEHDPECRVDKPNFVPHRLLHLGPDASIVQLFETQEYARSLQYACLSYCWGADTAGVLTTTRENIQIHLDRIPVAKLPKTIIDAITVCRELGIPNLWVDSLCIIQHDEQDFATEGSKMDSIYGNSYLTIYAQDPSSCKLGFLGLQTYGREQWQWLAPVTAPNGMSFFIRPNDDRYSENTGKKQLVKEPAALDTRGWCLQESILPRRQLIYCGTEMAWKCNRRHMCECGHVLTQQSSFFPKRGTVGLLRPDRALQITNMRSTKKVPKSFDHVVQWQGIVEDYCRRSLTMPTDKLPAVAGLATRLIHMASEFTGVQDNYHAGLWESKLIDQLCWRVVNEDPNSVLLRHRRLLNSVPTWSWASIHGQVFCRDYSLRFPKDPAMKMRHDARVEEVHCDPVLPQNPMGSVSGGYIALEASLVPLQLAILDEVLSEECDTLLGSKSYVCLVRGNASVADEVLLDVREEAPTVHHDSLWSQCWTGYE
ncbi:HET-domain-containing protein [Cadophora sp. DSE1049]|nr:HET-domain-containing protein [Cadophora sp. DSE1049]